MARDPLAILARLRRLAVMEARRDLADALAAEEAARDGAAAARRALDDEAKAGDRTGNAAAYGAWLPSGLARASAEQAKAAAAARAVERQILALAEARAAERAVAAVAERRAAEAKKRLERRLQAALDEAGASARRFRSEGGRRR